MRVRSVDGSSQLHHNRRLLSQLGPGWLGILLIFALSCPAFAGDCGGAVPCHCGDTVVADHAMTYDLGPCPRLSGEGVDTVGLVVRAGVTLDCQDHAVVGPGDTLKNAFGIRVGFRNVPTPTTDVTIKNCQVSRFWWGIYVQNAGNVGIDSNLLQQNGWKDPHRNGTGYGINVSNSQFVVVRDNRIVDSGNEGFHLSHSQDVTVENNLIADSGFEQLYLFFADNNTIRNNTATGGRQGLEMRWSNGNTFAYNTWANAPKHWLENNNSNNTFFYEHFQGLVLISGQSTDNRFALSAFENPAGQCLKTNAPGTYVYKGYFGSCKFDFRTNTPATLDRCTGVEKRAGRITVIFPGCTADFDRDGDVDDLDRVPLLAAFGSSLRTPDWNPEADLDHDGDVDSDDITVLDAQFGPCGP